MSAAAATLTERFEVVTGDCIEVMRTLPDACADCVVTDPPYGMSEQPDMVEVLTHWLRGDRYEHGSRGFMGKSWDSFVPGPEYWRECLRVLKPGGHLLAFAATRTYDLMSIAVRLGGFEVRDMLSWLYGTGFPKSLNIGDGRGTALKPACEPIVMARKPLVGTVAANVLAHGTGAINVDACRIGDEVVGWGGGGRGSGDGSTWSVESGTCGLRAGDPRPVSGRWPANVLLDEEAAAMLDEQSGTLSKPGNKAGRPTKQSVSNNIAFNSHDRIVDGGSFQYGDTGGASRFFYVAKASRKEREAGCESLPLRTAGEATDREDGSAGLNSPRAGAGRTGGARNRHPTVKPVALMRYLVRLVCPPGGSVLDPFVGSGTTGIAAVKEGFEFLGIEQDAEYAEIARARIAAAERGAT